MKYKYVNGYKVPKKKSSVKAFFSSIRSLLFSLAVLGGMAYGAHLLSSSPDVTTTATTTTATQSNATTSAQLKSGEDAELKTTYFMADSKEDYDQFSTLFIAKNTDAIKRMAEQGKLIPLNQGTRVTILDLGFLNGVSKVEIADGTFRGTQGYIDAAFLKALNK